MKIYYVNIREFDDEQDINKWTKYLCIERVEKIERCKQPDDKKRSLAAGLVLEYALREVGLTQKDCKLEYGKNGKPKITEEQEIHFNLSHAKDYAVVAFSKEEVGIDIEQIRKGKEKIAERFFSTEEKELLHEKWSDSTFTKIWTRKESFVKAYGTGLSIPIDQFSVLSDSVEKEAVYYLESVQFMQDYWISVCKKNRKPDIIMQEIHLRELNFD